MEKYGVSEDETTKTAEEGEPICPKCGQKLKSHGKVDLCDEHGSEPFEKEEESEGSD